MQYSYMYTIAFCFSNTSPTLAITFLHTCCFTNLTLSFLFAVGDLSIPIIMKYDLMHF